MIKKMKEAIVDGVTLMGGVLFTLAAAPVIHLSGLDNVDSCPTPEDIENSRRLAENLKGKQSR